MLNDATCFKAVYIVCGYTDIRSGMDRLAALWVYRTGRMYTDRQIVLYEYQRTRGASHPREFLKDFSGICVTDGYQVYHTVENEREDLKIAGCWSHARRRYDEAVKAPPTDRQAAGGDLFHMGTGKPPESAAEKQDLGRLQLFT